jgi:hypothetical protein
MFITKFNG